MVEVRGMVNFRKKAVYKDFLKSQKIYHNGE